MTSLFDTTDQLGAYLDRAPIERPKPIKTTQFQFRRKDLWPAEEWEKMQRIARGEDA